MACKKRNQCNEDPYSKAPEPVTEVGSMASAIGWLATCVSFYVVERDVRLRLIATLGMAVSLLLVLMKWFPAAPGHFTLAEWIALGAWLGLGLIFHQLAERTVSAD